MLIFIALAIYYVKTNYSEFKTLKLQNPTLILIIVPLFLFQYLFISIITKSLLNPFNVKISLYESFGLSITTGFYNLITPFKGGMAARAVYLKKKHGFSYIDFLSTLGASYIITFLITSFLGILSIFLIYLNGGIFSRLLLIIFLVFFLGPLFVIVFSPQIKETKNSFINMSRIGFSKVTILEHDQEPRKHFGINSRRVLDKFIKLANSWNLIKNNGKLIFIISLVSLAQLIIGVIMLYLQFRVFGIDVGLAECLFWISIGSLGIIVAITPAGLGINEAIAVFSALTIGITPTQSLSVALLGRAVSLIVLFILGPIFSYILLKKR